MLNDCLSAIRNYEITAADKVIKLANSKASKTQIDWAKKLRDKCVSILPLVSDKTSVYDIYKRCLLYLAPYDFDSYMQYMEIDREPSERFYLPRRKILKNPESRGILKKAYELLDLNMNNLMLNGKINPVSGIFLMKNHYGYRDQQDVVVAKDNLLGDATDNKALEEKYMKSIPCDVVEITPCDIMQNDEKQKAEP